MHAYRTHSCADLRDSRCRRNGPPVGLGAPQARPRPSAVRRPARSLRHHPDRHRHGIAGVQDARPDARGIGGHDRRRGRRARRPKRSTRTSPTGEIEVHARARSTVQSAAAELPMPVFGEQDYPEEIRLKYRYLDLRREQLHANIMLRSRGHRLDPPADDRPGLHRVPDADPDRSRRPKARATISSRAASIRASSTRSRRRRRCSSN